MRFHDLRHSCASLLLANGVPLKHIQEWLGHSDFTTTANIYAHLDYKSKIWLGHSTFSTTADIYAHLDYSAQEASANAMNGMFNRPEKEEQLA